MSKVKTTPWDASEYLDSPEAISEYLTAALEDGDPDLLLAVLGDIAKAEGMSAVAKRANLGRESLYKALAPGSKPRFDTVLKVLKALNVHLDARIEAHA
ncbi:putative addiction module antidote protein [Candidatus Parcubacteria bacterium]|nr:MAG: putative addiction module antidote protein [Candidatus Parcubacteria bacterium]